MSSFGLLGPWANQELGTGTYDVACEHCEVFLSMTSTQKIETIFKECVALSIGQCSWVLEKAQSPYEKCSLKISQCFPGGLDVLTLDLSPDYLYEAKDPHRPQLGALKASPKPNKSAQRGETVVVFLKGSCKLLIYARNGSGSIVKMNDYDSSLKTTVWERLCENIKRWDLAPFVGLRKTSEATYRTFRTLLCQNSENGNCQFSAYALALNSSLPR